MLKRGPKKLFLRYARKGDAEALGKVFDLLAPELLGLAIHLTRRVDLAEDVLQDTFLAAAESAQRFDPSRAFRPWIIGILVNRARKVRSAIGTSRVQAVGEGQLSGLVNDGRSAGAEDPGKEAEAKEVRGRVATAIGTLQSPYHEVVNAHLTDGLAAREIAPILGRAPGTVRVQLHRGLEQLRGALAAEDGIGGLEMLSLAPTSALMLSADTGRGLAAVKLKVLASLPKTGAVAAGSVAAGGSIAAGGAAGGAVGAGGGGIGSGITFAGGSFLLAVGLWTAQQVRSDNVSHQSRVPVITTAAAAPPPAAAPVLTEVDRRDRRATAPIPTMSGESGSRRERPSRRAEKDSSEASETAQATVATEEPGPLLYEFRIEPSFDRSDIGDFNSFEQCHFDSHSGDSTSYFGKGQEVFRDFRGFSIGHFASPFDLPDPLILHFDHPGALPCELTLSPRSWVAQADGYVVRPVLFLEKIERTVRVRSGSTRTSTAPYASHFEGEALLVSFDATGRPTVHDRQSVAPGFRKGAWLRAPLGLSDPVVLGIPTSPNVFSDAAEARPSDSGEQGAVLKARPLPAIGVTVEDPFGHPMAGLEIRAIVPVEVPSMRDPETDEHVLIEGRVLCSCDRRQVKGYGASVTFGEELQPLSPPEPGDAASRATILAVTQRVTGTTDDSGRVVLSGVVLGVHTFEAKSPLTGAWVRVKGQLSEQPSARGLSARSVVAYQLDPPVAGLEIEAPEGLVDLGGDPSPWKGTQIRISGGDFDLSFEPGAKAKRIVRALIPPGQGLVVEAFAGDLEFSALARSLPAGERHLVAPMRVPRKAGRK